MNLCNHIITENDKCIVCGKLIFKTETRTCSQCVFFKKYINGIPTCKKKLMTVTGDMHVYYKAEDGTCFE